MESDQSHALDGGLVSSSNRAEVDENGRMADVVVRTLPTFCGMFKL